VEAILKQGARSLSTKGYISISSLKRKLAERLKSIAIDDFAEGEMRREIHEFYTVR
jgi:hypothetical protein